MFSWICSRQQQDINFSLVTCSPFKRLTVKDLEQFNGLEFWYNCIIEDICLSLHYLFCTSRTYHVYFYLVQPVRNINQLDVDVDVFSN